MADAPEPAHPHLGHAGNGLAPTERLLHELASPQAYCVASMPRRARIDRRALDLLCHVWGHALEPQISNEVRRVVRLLGADGDAPLGSRIVPVDHRQRSLALGLAGPGRRLRLPDQPVPGLARCVGQVVELRRLAAALAEQLGLWVGLALVRGVGALLPWKLLSPLRPGAGG